MRKSGLHKQISSIFDGVPMPKNNLATEDIDSTSVQQSPDTESIETGATKPTAAPATQNTNETAKSSLIKRLSADPSECTSTPSIQVNRPMPLPKSSLSTHKSVTGFPGIKKKSVLGSGKKSMAPHQKKMAVLVGVLSVVFAVVLYLSLGGVGTSQVSAADDKANDSSSSSNTTVNPQDWKSPEPLSADLRNATAPVTQEVVVPGETDIEPIPNNSDELVVKGIVFSKTRPTAIINNEIMSEGEMINGIKIVKITKSAVEFEENGNRWSQTVKR